MRVIRFIRAKDPLLLEKFLNELTDIVIIGSPVWDGKKWAAWLLTTNKRIKSGDIDQ